MSLLDALRSKGAVVVDYTAEVKEIVQKLKEHEEKKNHKRSIEEIEKMAELLNLKENK